MLRIEQRQQGKTDRLWGHHTMEICHVDCPLHQSTSSTDITSTTAATKSLKSKQLESDAIILVSQDGLLFVLINDPKEAVVDMTAAFRRGNKYVIPFKAISDIRELKTEDQEGIKIGPIKSNGALKPRTVVVHIKGNDAVCRIDTNGATHLAKQMLAAWYAYLVMQSALLGNVRIGANVRLAEDYLFETIKDLNDVGDRKRPHEEMLDEKRIILDEFAAECWVDLQLKELALRTREIMVTCCKLCTDLLHAPPPRIQPKRAAGLPPPQRLLFSSYTTFQKTNDVNSEVQTRLQTTALQRMSVLHSSLKAMASVLLGSESISSRHGMLSGPIPLDISAWCELLVPDLYVKMCTTLGCPPEDEEEEIVRALQASSHVGMTRINQSTEMSSRQISSVSRSDIWLKTTGQHVADSVLTPLKANVQQKTERIESLLEGVSPFGSSLIEVRRAVRDLQNVIAYELASIAAIGYSALNKTILSRNPNAPAAPHAVLYFGDSFSRKDQWENTLEQIVVRVSTLLDDMLCSEQLSKDALLEADAPSITWTSCRSPKKQTSAYGRASPTSRGGSPTRPPRTTGNKNNENENDNNQGSMKQFFTSIDGSEGEEVLTPKRPPVAPARRTPSGRHPLSLSVPGDDSDTASGRDEMRLARRSYELEKPVRRRRLSEAIVQEVRKSIDQGSEFAGYDPFAEEMSISLDVDLLQASRRQASVPPSPHPSTKKLAVQQQQTDRKNRRVRRMALDALNEGTSSESDRDPSRLLNHSSAVAAETKKANELKRKARSPIETQEILLFYMLSLLHTMVLDSARIRKALSGDLQNYWVAIMQVFNLVCPRPRILPKRPKSPTKTSRASNYDDFRAAGRALAASAVQQPDRVQAGNGPLGLAPEIPPKQGFFSRLSAGTANMFKGKKKAPNSPTRAELLLEKEAKNLVLPEYITTNEEDKKFKAAATLIEENLTALLLADYGPPQHGLSAAAWRLLVLCRRMTEEILVELDLHRSIPFRVVEPTQRDINKLHQLRSLGASGHVRRRVLDFMTDLNESGKDAGGMDWSGKSNDSMDDILNSATETFTKGGDKKRSIWVSEKNDSDDDVLSNLIKSRQQELKQQQEERGMSTAVQKSSSAAGGRKNRELDQDKPQQREEEPSTGRKATVRNKIMSIDTDNHNPKSSSTLAAPKEAVSPIRMRNR